jgi:hypothetical protein
VRITSAAARRILRGQGMPPREIRAVLAADDPLTGTCGKSFAKRKPDVLGRNPGIEQLAMVGPLS